MWHVCLFDVCVSVCILGGCPIYSISVYSNVYLINTIYICRTTFACLCACACAYYITHVLLCAAVSLCAVSVGVGGHITVYSVQCIHSSVSVARARIYCSIYTNTNMYMGYILNMILWLLCVYACVDVYVYVYMSIRYKM